MKIYYYIKFIVFFALAVLLCFYHLEAIDNLRYIVSSLMIFFGLESMVLSIIRNKKDFYRDIWFAFGGAELLVGLTLLFGVEEFVAICVTWAVWTILRETIDLHEIAKGDIKGVTAIISGIESIVAIAFSILLIVTPSTYHAHTHVILLIVELIVTVLTPIIPELGGRYKKERAKKTINS